MLAATFARELSYAVRVEGFSVAAFQSFLAMVFLTVALARVIRVTTFCSLKPSALLLAGCFVIVTIPVVAGAVLYAQFDPIGLHPEKDFRAPTPAVPVERDVRVAALQKMWRSVRQQRPGPDSTRDDITTISAREWAIPGEAGANWLYIRGENGAFFIAEPFPVDGERLLTEDGITVRPLNDADTERIRKSPGGGL